MTRALLAGLVALTACGSTEGPSDGGGSTPCDAGTAPENWTYPPGPYGSNPGDVLEDFTLSDCEGNEVRFGDILGASQLTLFSTGAGWCQPCIDETRTFESELVGPFCHRGLRIVQVLFEDEDGFPATKLFCREWKERFGLTIPVLVDPLFETRVHFEAAQTPLNLLVTPDGVIRYRATGEAPADLPDRIDALLEGE